jgi:hypothetical protein
MLKNGGAFDKRDHDDGWEVGKAGDDPSPLRSLRLGLKDSRHCESMLAITVADREEERLDSTLVTGFRDLRA